MKFSVEINTIYDMAMLDTIIDLWREKFAKDYEGIEEDLNDAEDESENCDNDETEDGDATDQDKEAEARAEAMRQLADALRDAGIRVCNFGLLRFDK